MLRSMFFKWLGDPHALCHGYIYIYILSLISHQIARVALLSFNCVTVCWVTCMSACVEVWMVEWCTGFWMVVVCMSVNCCARCLCTVVHCKCEWLCTVWMVCTVCLWMYFILIEGLLVLYSITTASITKQRNLKKQKWVSGFRLKIEFENSYMLSQN